jgi:hypothetical protein
MIVQLTMANAPDGAEQEKALLRAFLRVREGAQR